MSRDDKLWHLKARNAELREVNAELLGMLKRARRYFGFCSDPIAADMDEIINKAEKLVSRESPLMRYSPACESAVSYKYEQEQRRREFENGIIIPKAVQKAEVKVFGKAERDNEKCGVWKAT